MVFRKVGWASTRKITTAFWLVFIALAALQCVAYYHRWSREDENRRQERSQQALNDLELLLLDMRDAQTGERGYVITGDEAYLAPYTRAVADIPSRLESVKREAADSDVLRNVDLQPLQRRLTSALAEISALIDLRRKQGLAPAAAEIRAQRNQALMSDVQQEVETLRTEETAALARHTANEQQSIRNNLLMYGVLTAADFLLLALGYWGINRYAAHRRRAETTLAKAYQSAEAARALAEAEHASSASANRVKDRILRTVSHDLRTPLNNVVMWAEMLKRASAGEVQEAADAILRSVESQVRLINDLLDASRMERGVLRVEKTEIPLGQVLNAAVEALMPLAERHEVELRGAFAAADETIVLGDSLRLQQVFWNLISNAIKFTPACGHVEVEARRIGGQIEVEVRDTGRGISAEFLPHLFEPFSQAGGDQSSHNEGIGLGLAIVKHLVELHGGTVQAHSDGPGCGARFVVRLTVVAERARAGTKPERALA